MRTRSLLPFLMGCVLALPLLAAEDRAREAELRIHEMRKEKRYKEALAYLDLAVKESPDSGNLRGLFCWIHLEDLKDPKTALDYALRLKQDLPKHVGGYYWSAKAYEALGDYGKCVATLDDYRSYGRDFVRDNVKASCYYKSGQLEEAIKALPDDEKLRDSYPKYAGWGVWLRGQIARRKLFAEMKPKLRAQATSPSARERTIALAKLALVGVPEGAELAQLAGAADKGALKTVAENLTRELTAEPRFFRELAAPSTSNQSKSVPLEDALAEISRALDERPIPGKIPPIAGKYMTQDMLDLAKKYPSAAVPFVVHVSETGDQYSFAASAAAWNKANGEVDTSFLPGRCYSISHVQDGAIRIVSACLKNRFSDFSITTYRPDGRDLQLASRSWTDIGDACQTFESVTTFLRIP